MFQSPIVQGWGLLKVNELWKPRWIILESGALWVYSDETQQKNSNVFHIQSSLDNNNKGHFLPSGEEVLSLKVKNYKRDVHNKCDNIITIEIGLNKNEIPLWKFGIELHYKIYLLPNEVNNVHVPNNSSTEIDNNIDILEAQVTTVYLDGKSHNLSISLTDDASTIVDNFINKRGMSNPITNEEKYRIELKLLRLQKSFSDRIISNYFKLKGTVQRSQKEILYLEERLFSSEKHSNNLNKSFVNVEYLLPKVISLLETEKIKRRNLELELTDCKFDIKSQKESMINVKLENSELRIRLGDKSFDDNFTSLQSNYDNINNKLLKSQEQVSQLEIELEAIKEFSASSVMVDNLTSENRLLREQCSSLRREVVTLRTNITDIQLSAVQAMQALQGEGGEGYCLSIDSSLHEVTDALLQSINNNNTSHCEEQGLEKKELEEEEELVDNNNRSPNGKSFSESFKREDAISMAAVAMEVKSVESAFTRNLYMRYVSYEDKKGFMNLTRFFRFAREFQITSSNLSTSVSFNYSSNNNNNNNSNNGTESTLGYGIVSTIFTNACSAVTGSKTTASHMSLPQFTIALEQLAVKMFSHLMQQQMGSLIESLPKKQKLVATRAAYMLMVKTKLIPSAMLLDDDLIPWPTVYVHEALTTITECDKNIILNHSELITSLYQMDGEVDYNNISQLLHSLKIIPKFLNEPKFFRLFQESLNWFKINSHIPVFSPEVVTSLLSKNSKIIQPSIDNLDIIFFTMIIVVVAMQCFLTSPREKRIDLMFEWIIKSNNKL